MPPSLSSAGRERARPHSMLWSGESFATASALADFVSERYSSLFDAHVEHHLPDLIGLLDARGRVLGAGGARCGQSGKGLFLDVYLDEPVETLLSRRIGQPITRCELAEVGNVVTASHGCGCPLVTLLAAWLHGHGIEWAVFTASKPLRTLLERMNVELIDLAPADGTRLGKDLADWGTYYDTQPRVMAARTSQTRERGLERMPELASLASYAFILGAESSRAYVA